MPCHAFDVVVFRFINNRRWLSFTEVAAKSLAILVWFRTTSFEVAAKSPNTQQRLAMLLGFALLCLRSLRSRPKRNDGGAVFVMFATRF